MRIAHTQSHTLCVPFLPLFSCCQFSVLASVHIADSIRHTAGRPDAVWAEANSFFGHDKKHAKMARQAAKAASKAGIPELTTDETPDPTPRVQPKKTSRSKRKGTTS